jgi:hypothetical protein
MTLRRFKTFARFFSGKILSMVPQLNIPARILGGLCLLVIVLSGCAASIQPTGATPTSPPIALDQPTASLSPSPTITATATDVPTPTPIRTPPALPGGFQTTLLNPLDPPHSYVSDTCQYLRDKWSSTNSPPGTVAMVIMFHSIVSNEISPDANQISEEKFHALIGSLMNAGFEAITTKQLDDFMEHNAKIPEHSVLLVVDDRHHAQYFDTFFRELWQLDGWPVVNAWISASRDGYDASLWQDQEILNAEGWVDYQAHGVVHNYPMWPGASDAYITTELQGSIDAFQLHFKKVPIAIIWPGGGFSSRSVETARQLGYRLGFTVNPRGPLMFNWVPLADTSDPQRPSWIPEGPLNDPLLVLPRYWDTDAIIHLPKVVQIGQEAAAYAQQNKTTELEYYDIVCAGQYGPLP